jgi:phosphoglycolate phosphatase-like HAD superfamily hydrolase
MRDLQLVIFDCDGVLVDSEVISNEVLARALTAEGLPTTLAEARRYYQGLLLADIDSRAHAKLGRPLAMGPLGYSIPFTVTGTSLLVVVPSPTWPLALYPQQSKAPLANDAHV